MNAIARCNRQARLFGERKELLDGIEPPLVTEVLEPEPFPMRSEASAGESAASLELMFGPDPVTQLAQMFAGHEQP